MLLLAALAVGAAALGERWVSHGLGTFLIVVDNPLDVFSGPTRAWFGSTFAAPTAPQAEGWPAIAAGDHTLVCAPTGTGKTLAAFLWAIDRLMAGGSPDPAGGVAVERPRGWTPGLMAGGSPDPAGGSEGRDLGGDGICGRGARRPAALQGGRARSEGASRLGTRVLYVSPLRALAVDVEKNLRAPLRGIRLAGERLGAAVHEPAVGVRTGDTSADERRRLARSPPDILITTPESLFLMLTSRARQTLAAVEHVIIDEIHAVAGSKRGTHLMVSLERLEELCERPPQRIALSATQRPLDEIARFLGGFAPGAPGAPGARGVGGPRPVTVVNADARKELDVEVVVPVADMASLGETVEQPLSAGAAAAPLRRSIWPAIHPRLLELVQSHRSTLIFANARRLAERLAARLNELHVEGYARDPGGGDTGVGGFSDSRVGGSGRGVGQSSVSVGGGGARLEDCAPVGGSGVVGGAAGGGFSDSRVGGSGRAEAGVLGGGDAARFSDSRVEGSGRGVGQSSVSVGGGGARLEDCVLVGGSGVVGGAAGGGFSDSRVGGSGRGVGQSSVSVGGGGARLEDCVLVGGSGVVGGAAGGGPASAGGVAGGLARAPAAPAAPAGDEQAGIGAVDGAELVKAHHGSLSRQRRLLIEDELKRGELRGLVATSTLELGIDMGAVDLVVQVASPGSVASGLQRIGRAGHRVGEPSRGRIFPKHRADLLEAAAVVERMHAGEVEHTRYLRNPLDVAAQQIVAMCAMDDWTVERLASVLRRCAGFADLSDEVLHSVLDLVSGTYPAEEFAGLRPRVSWDRAAGVLRGRAGAQRLAVTNAGTIPDRGMFGVFLPDGGRVGELDEEMVYESRVGETFLLGATTWRIVDITFERVVVTPAPGELGKMPFWHGDGPGRPIELGRAVGRLARELRACRDPPAAEDRLRRRCGLDESAASNLLAYLDDQAESTGAVPDDRTVVVERFRDEIGDWRVCVLTPFGAQVHAPWGMALQSRLGEAWGIDVDLMWSDDGIVMRLPEAVEELPVDDLLFDPDEIGDLVVGRLPETSMFASRFRECAARALLLPRRRPDQRTPLWQQRQRAADLLSVATRHPSFPILMETTRECVNDVFDLPALVELMSDLRSRRIRVVAVDTPQASPFAQSLLFSWIAVYMYEGDAPPAERRAAALALDRDLLRDLLGAEELRELLDAGVIADIELELQRLAPGRGARDADEAHDLLRVLGPLTMAALSARTAAPGAVPAVAGAAGAAGAAGGVVAGGAVTGLGVGAGAVSDAVVSGAAAGAGVVAVGGGSADADAGGAGAAAGGSADADAVAGAAVADADAAVSAAAGGVGGAVAVGGADAVSDAVVSVGADAGLGAGTDVGGGGADAVSDAVVSVGADAGLGAAAGVGGADAVSDAVVSVGADAGLGAGGGVGGADAVSDAVVSVGAGTDVGDGGGSAGGSGVVAGWVRSLVGQRRAIEVRLAGREVVADAADAARLRDAAGVGLPVGLPAYAVEPVEDPLGDLCVRFARTHGPFVARDVARWLGVGEQRAAARLASLVSEGRLLRGEFRPGGHEREFCDPEVLRRIRRRCLAALRQEVEPVPPEALARFLPAWQGVGSRRRGIDALADAVAQLQGAPVAASVLEADVLSSRMLGYKPSDLDELCTSGEVVWIGAGAVGASDGRVRLVFRDQAPLLAPAAGEPSTGAVHDALRERLRDRGASFWPDLVAAAQAASLPYDAETVLAALWDLVWAGEVTNDSLAPLRARIARRRAPGSARRPPPRRPPPRRGRLRLGGLTASGPPSGAGRWSLVEPMLRPEPAAAETALSQAHQLLDRYGVVTRETALAEGCEGGFAGVYPVLKALEERGEVRRGYFVAGLGAAQFALPGAVERLRGARAADPSEPPLVLAATDPAQPWGAALAWPESPGRPARTLGAHVVLADGVPLAQLERGGRSLVTFAGAESTDDWIEAVVGLVKDGRLPKLEIAKVDGAAIRETPWAARLEAAGFTPAYRGMLYRR